MRDSSPQIFPEMAVPLQSCTFYGKDLGSLCSSWSGVIKGKSSFHQTPLFGFDIPSLDSR